MLARNGLLALSIAAGIQVLKTMLDVEVEEKAGPKGSTTRTEPYTAMELKKRLWFWTGEK